MKTQQSASTSQTAAIPSNPTSAQSNGISTPISRENNVPNGTPNTETPDVPLPQQPNDLQEITPSSNERGIVPRVLTYETNDIQYSQQTTSLEDNQDTDYCTNSRNVKLKIGDIIVLGRDVHEYWLAEIISFIQPKSSKAAKPIEKCKLVYLREVDGGKLEYWLEKGKKWFDTQNIHSILMVLDDKSITEDIKQEITRISEFEYEGF